MGARGSAERTKAEILAAARKLFSERDFKSVTVRDIAAEAGVNHALVHRYFGTKEEMAAEILRREVAELSRRPDDGSDAIQTLDALRAVLENALTEGRGTLELVVRTELSGLAPEDMLEGSSRRLAVLGEWIGSRQQQTGETRRDPKLVSAVVGAALLSFATMPQWLMTSVGLKPEDYEARRDEILDILVDVAAHSAGDHAHSRGGV